MAVVTVVQDESGSVAIGYNTCRHSVNQRSSTAGARLTTKHR